MAPTTRSQSAKITKVKKHRPAKKVQSFKNVRPTKRVKPVRRVEPIVSMNSPTVTDAEVANPGFDVGKWGPVAVRYVLMRSKELQQHLEKARNEKEKNKIRAEIEKLQDPRQQRWRTHVQDSGHQWYASDGTWDAYAILKDSEAGREFMKLIYEDDRIQFIKKRATTHFVVGDVGHLINW